MGVYAAKLIRGKQFGDTVAVVDGRITSNLMKDVAGKTKVIPLDSRLLEVGRDIGLSFGEPKTEKTADKD
jgi:6-phosphofructokinase 1